MAQRRHERFKLVQQPGGGLSFKLLQPSGLDAASGRGGQLDETGYAHARQGKARK